MWRQIVLARAFAAPPGSDHHDRDGKKQRGEFHPRAPRLAAHIRRHLLPVGVSLPRRLFVGYSGLYDVEGRADGATRSGG